MWHIWNKLFGWHYCVLIDHDGEENIRRAYKSPSGVFYAWRYSAIQTCMCRLLPDGTASGPSYVHYWVGLTNFVPGQTEYGPKK